jgi:hypothetical protein
MATVDKQLREAIEGLSRSVSRLQAAAGVPVPPAPTPRPGEKDLSGGRVNPPSLASTDVLPQGLRDSMTGLSEVFELLARGPINPPPAGHDGGLRDAIESMTSAVDNLARSLGASGGEKP